MLIRFSVENFLSFNNVQEFSMIPGNIRERENHLITNEYSKVLRLGTIYGANAAGKSNLIKAMNFAKNIVDGDIPLAAHKLFCKVNKDNEYRASRFEFEFIKENKCYAYGFKILLKERKILSEWLYELNEKEQNEIFERETEKGRLNFNIEPSSDEDKMRLRLYELDFSSNTNKLLITEAKEKRFSADSSLVVFKNVFDWFDNDLRVIYPEQPMMKFDSFFGEDSNQRINRIIKLFDTGISRIKEEKITTEKLKDELSSNEIERFLNNYKEATDKFVEFLRDINSFKTKNDNILNKKIEDMKKNVEVSSSLRTRDSFYNMRGKIGEEPSISTIRTEHEKSFFDYTFKEESDGTRRLFDLLEVLLSNGEELNRVYVIDELERSLHPKLTYRFLELFIKVLAKKRVQLIFTTHESTIMDQNLLRRDEVWFVERNKENASRIYSLDRFKERYDKKLNKAYLEGRYGAIPIFKDFSFEEDL